jgi:hypothetical protein
MTYACLFCKFAANTYLLKLQQLQNKVLHTIGNCTSCKLFCDFQTAFNLPYEYNYTAKLCREKAEVIQNNENDHVCSIRQGEARCKKYKRLKLDGSQACNSSSDYAATVA